jgi:hypothetical protein
MDNELVRAAPAVDAACLPPSKRALYPRGDGRRSKERASGVGAGCRSNKRQQVECASTRLTLRPVPVIFLSECGFGRGRAPS